MIPESQQQLHSLVEYCTEFIGTDIDTFRQSTLEELMPRNALERLFRMPVSAQHAYLMVMLSTTVPEINCDSALKMYESTGEFLEWCLKRHFEDPDVRELEWISHARESAHAPS